MPPHEKRMSVDIRRKCVSCPFDSLTRRSSLGNLRVFFVRVPLLTSFVFHALNVIRYSCVDLCGTRVTWPNTGLPCTTAR